MASTRPQMCTGDAAHRCDMEPSRDMGDTRVGAGHERSSLGEERRTGPYEAVLVGPFKRFTADPAAASPVP